MSFPDPRVQAIEELKAAAENLLQATAAYRNAWHYQREATERLALAGDCLQEWQLSARVPDKVREQARSLAAAADGAAILKLVRVEEEAEQLEAEARAVEDVANAARALADALFRAGSAATDGGDA